MMRWPILQRSHDETTKRLTFLTAGLVLSLLILAGCGGETQDSEARVATRVAEDRAVAATLTAEAIATARPVLRA